MNRDEKGHFTKSTEKRYVLSCRLSETEMELIDMALRAIQFQKQCSDRVLRLRQRLETYRREVK